MKRFLETFKLSLTSRDFYKRVVQGAEPMGFKFFFILVVIGAFIQTLTFIPLVFELKSQESQNKLLGYIPKDLVVTMQDGKTSINQSEPYFIKDERTEAQIAEDCDQDQLCITKSLKSKNVIVFDTKTPFTMEQFKSYETIVLVKEDSIVAKKSNGQIQIIPNSKESFSVNREWVGTMIARYIWIVNLIPVVAFPALIAMGYIAGLFSYLYWMLVVWIMLQIGKKSITLKRAYSVALYLTAFMFFLDILGDLVPFFAYGTVRTIIYIIALYVIFFKGSGSVKGGHHSTEHHVKEHAESHSSDAVHATRISDDDTNNGTK